MKKNVLVTATGGRSVGSGILHCLTRSSTEVSSRWNVVASDADSFAWGLYKTPQSVLLPLANSPDYKHALHQVIRDFKIDAIIPGSEPEASLLSGCNDEFDVPIITNAHNLMPLMMDKFKATEKLTELGLPVIPTYRVNDWQIALRDFDFPFIVKPTKGTGGSKGVTLCTDKAELAKVIGNLPPNSFYCIQPLIGTENDEYTVGILSDKDGNLIDSVVMKRKLIGLSLLDTKKVNNQNYSISTGYSQGFFIKDQVIQSFCEKLSLLLGSRGPLNIQLRIHKGEVYVFEIHPRFSGTTTMRGDIGFNEPDVLLRNHLYGEKFARLGYLTNVAAIRAFEHVIVPINEMIK